MFKKSLAAVALLGAFAGSAFAADVTLYGVVDEGFLYTHKDADKTDTDAVDKFELRNGIQAGSRWGLKGTEDLGNGLKVASSSKAVSTLTTARRVFPARCSIVKLHSMSWGLLVS
nr:porin [Sutterella wadsworthensis]